MELIKLGEKTYYIKNYTNIGIYKVDDENVYLIDSGNDKDAGKKILKIIDEQGWKVKGIITTHSNADHIGGNQYLQKQTGCKIYAPGIECDFTNHTILEPAYLYGGCPPKDLRHKFLAAQESIEEYLTEDALPEGLEIINLPGHFFDMVGFRTKDDVVYLADCLSSKETLDKYQISVLYDVENYLKTLEMVKPMKAKMFLPSHAEPTEDISALAQYNIEKVHEIAEKIMEICNEPKCFEVILQTLFTEYSLKMTFEQHVLVGSTVRSYLAWLKDNGRLEVIFENNMLLWKSIYG